MSRKKSSEPEFEEAELSKALQADLSTVIDGFPEDNYPVETRRSLYEPYMTVMEAGYQLTGEPIKWVPPGENPTSDEMAKSVAHLSEAIGRATLSERAQISDIKQFRDAIATLHNKLEQASTLDYAFVEEDVRKKYGRWVQSIGVRDDLDPATVQGDGREIYAGPRARVELEREPRAARNLPNYDVPLFLGTGVRKGKDATVPKPTLYRHSAILGVTGYGKSTLLTNMEKQIVESGQGLCFIDPKGDDSERLIEILPEDRTEDVIWIEPGSTSGKISGFNFINVGLDPDHPQIETAVAALVSDLKKMLGAGEYWGPRMDRIAGNLIRAMNVFNRKYPNKPDLNLADFYYVLQDPRSRREFSILVAAAGIDFVEDYTEKIAEMDDDKLEPILGRMQPWIESPVARRMICFRDNEINIPQAVQDGKIIIVRMGGQPKDLKQMLGMAVVRRIWAAIRARADMATHDRTPFYLFIDEAHNIALSDDTFPTMLAESRSYRLSINLATQYLSQLPENVVRAVRVNCDTMMTFNSGSLQEARKVAPQLDLDPQALLNEARFHIWMRMADPEGGEVSDPFKVYIHPPFPPYRTADRAQEIITDALDRCGREKITPEERKSRLQFYKGDGELETGAGQQVLLAEEDPDMPPETAEAIKENAIEERKKMLSGKRKDPDEESASRDEIEEKDSSELDPEDRKILESIFAARIKAGYEPGVPVEKNKVNAEIQERIGEIGYGSDIANAIEALVKFAELTTVEGEESVRLTQEGKAQVFTATGESITGGLLGHRRILREAFKLFTRIGYHTTLPTQEGAELPDGIADTPYDGPDINLAGKSLREKQRLLNEHMEKVKEEYPQIAQLSDGDPVRIEAETSTHLRPSHTLQNLRKSINVGEKTVFVTKDGYFDDDVPDYAERPTAWWGRYIERIFYDQKETDGYGTEAKYEDDVILAKTREEGTVYFYNKDGDYEVTVEGNEYKALRPADEGRKTTWKETPDGTVVAEGQGTYDQLEGEEQVFATFESQQEVAAQKPENVPAYYYYDNAEEEFVVIPRDGRQETYETREKMEGRWETFNPPFLPEVEFDRQPTREDFIIIVIPDNDNPEWKQPLLIDEGTVTPLYDDLGISVPDHAYLSEDTSEAADQTISEDSTGDDKEGHDHDREQDETSQTNAGETGDGSTTGQQQSKPTASEYLFPDVRGHSDLPELCPNCGSSSLTIQKGQPFVGPGPTIENFPAAAAALSEQGILEMEDPPRITEVIDLSVASCADCQLVAPLYLPTESTGTQAKEQAGNPDEASKSDGDEDTDQQIDSKKHREVDRDETTRDKIEVS